MHRSRTVYKRKQFRTGLNKYVVGFWLWEVWIGVRGWTFSLEEVLLWIMDSYFDQKWWFKVKNLSMMILFITNLFTSQDIYLWVMWITCGWSWCFHQLFGLSFWRPPIHCRGCWPSDAMINFSKSILMKKQTHLHPGWPEGEYISVPCMVIL